MDPHSIGRLDPDPHSECRPRFWRSKKSKNEVEKENAAKRQLITVGIKSIKINVIVIKMLLVTLFSLKFNIIFYFDKKNVLTLSRIRIRVDPRSFLKAGAGSA
jgi:hypothetical protein